MRTHLGPCIVTINDRNSCARNVPFIHLLLYKLLKCRRDHFNMTIGDLNGSRGRGSSDMAEQRLHNSHSSDAVAA